MPGETLYTLTEARAEIARRECALHGHDFNIICVTGSLDPVALVCERCGRTLQVVS